MLTALEIAIILLSTLVLVPVLLLFIQFIMALPPTPAPAGLSGSRPDVAVLIPAHNEAVVIARTLRSVRPQLRNGERILVVADNCSDQTAAIARRLGAEVLERVDPVRRGKGYALDFGLRHLANAPPQVVIMIDADCTFSAGAINRLAQTCQQTMRPVQALNLMHAPKNAGVGLKMAEFAWVLKNHVRPLAYHRLGLPCQLSGTGMAFPWRVIDQAALANGHIAEDMKLGIDLALAGTPACFCPAAIVTSTFPISGETIRTQRTRWEHGHLGMILSHGPKLLWQSMVRMDFRLLALALDLCVPPLALLAFLMLALLLINGTFLAFTGIALPWLLATSAIAMLGAALMLTWVSYGRHVLSFANLAYMPIYALRKIPLYLKFVVSKQVEWVRSRRDEV